MPQEANKTQVISLDDTRTDMLGWVSRHWVVEDAGDTMLVWCRQHRSTEKWDVFNTRSQRDIAPSRVRHRRIVEAVKAHITWRVRAHSHEQSRDHLDRRRYDRYYFALDETGAEFFIGQHFVDGDLEPWTILAEPTAAEVDPLTAPGKALTALVREFDQFQEATR